MSTPIPPALTPRPCLVVEDTRAPMTHAIQHLLDLFGAGRVRMVDVTRGRVTGLEVETPNRTVEVQVQDLSPFILIEQGTQSSGAVGLVWAKNRRDAGDLGVRLGWGPEFSVHLPEEVSPETLAQVLS